MKNSVLLLSLSLLFCAPAKAQYKAAITFVNNDSVYDFGAVAAGNKPQYKFEIRNTGNAPLRITNVKGETPNYTFEWPSKPVKPHKKALIYVTYTPKSATAAGSFASAIFITSNATGQPYPFMHISGTLVPHRGRKETPDADKDSHITLYGPAPGLTPQ